MGGVYFSASYDVTDAERYEREYVPGVVASLAAAAGGTVVATGSAEMLEGTTAGHTVVFRFASVEAFRNWYDGPDYTSLRSLRSATTTNNTAVLARQFGAAHDDR